MIRAPTTSAANEADDPEAALPTSRAHPQANRPKQFPNGPSAESRSRSSNSLSRDDFDAIKDDDHDDESDDNFWIHPAEANEADDEIEPVDYEEQKRRRSFERRIHRQVQRRGSVDDYEQSDDVQFVQRIQSYDSLTGTEIAKLTISSPVPIAKVNLPSARVGRRLPNGSPDSALQKSAPSSRVQQSPPKASAPSPGHGRKNTLDTWKEQAAELKNQPAFPPHRNSSCSANPTLTMKQQTQAKKPLQRSGTFQKLTIADDDDVPEEDETGDDHEAGNEMPSPTATVHDRWVSWPNPRAITPMQGSGHDRQPTLQEWKSRIVQEQLLEKKTGSRTEADEFEAIEDQSWTSNVICSDTLKRFKQQQVPSIASGDLFAPPSSAIEESIAEEPEQMAPSPGGTEAESPASPVDEDVPECADKELPMRELIRDCLRVIATMSRSGLINQMQKIALKGLALRKDARIIGIAERYRQASAKAVETDDREVIIHDMELAMARLACNID